jgi:hypothetical protein
MTSGRRWWWLAGAVLGVLFVLLNLADLVFSDGDSGRDLVGMALGGVMAIVAFGRYRGWTGVRR